MDFFQAEHRILCGCKINIFLRITGRRDDGYHLLQSVFLPLDNPCDELLITPGKKSGIEFYCTAPELQNENIVVRAYEKFALKTGFKPAIRVRLNKNIPSGAGLGGGSSDAAGMLRYLNQAAGDYSISRKDLSDLALNLGADVPFFLQSVPALVSGIGERIKPVSLSPRRIFGLLLCPEIHISTHEAYKAWDSRPRECFGLKNLTNFEGGDKYTPFIHNFVLYNDFEPVVFTDNPKLAQLKLSAYQYGSCGCVMSGSGSALAVFFRKNRSRDKFHAYVRRSGIQCYPFK